MNMGDSVAGQRLSRQRKEDTPAWNVWGSATDVSGGRVH
jgi:hypothetical protein